MKNFFETAGDKKIHWCTGVRMPDSLLIEQKRQWGFVSKSGH